MAGGFYVELLRLKFWLFTANGYFLSVTVNKKQNFYKVKKKIVSTVVINI